jgi:hypothetical protein
MIAGLMTFATAEVAYGFGLSHIAIEEGKKCVESGYAHGGADKKMYYAPLHFTANSNKSISKEFQTSKYTLDEYVPGVSKVLSLGKKVNGIELDFSIPVPSTKQSYFHAISDAYVRYISPLGATMAWAKMEIHKKPCALGYFCGGGRGSSSIIPVGHATAEVPAQIHNRRIGSVEIYLRGYSNPNVAMPEEFTRPTLEQVQLRVRDVRFYETVPCE